MKLAVLFPGQGSQKTGMGEDIYNEFEEAREIFKKANNILSRNIDEIIFKGPDEKLNQTENTQPAITITSIVLVTILKKLLKNKNLEFSPYATAGHSLGEFVALWFGGVLNLEDTIKTVSLRGSLMQNAPSGTMAAILNAPQDKLEELLKIKYNSKIIIANYNCPTQHVISGEKELFSTIPNDIKEIGGKTIMLPVSGAFHSPLMEKPSGDFSKILNTLTFNNSNIPIFQNYDGNSSSEGKIIREKINNQMTSSVFWTQTINNLVKLGVDNVVEIGPGKVLTGLVKKINPNLITHNVSDLESLKSFIELYATTTLQPTN